jgi:hypothetical protein
MFDHIHKSHTMTVRLDHTTSPDAGIAVSMATWKIRSIHTRVAKNKNNRETCGGVNATRIDVTQTRAYTIDIA